MAKITRFFPAIEVTPAGLEITNIINSQTYLHTGTIEQIVIKEIAGDATSMDVQIRYEQGVDDRDKLAYLFVNATLPLFVDSNVPAPFSLVNPRTEGDLHLYIETDSNCVLDIRIDMDINNLSGL